jgi:hypothetical protein
MQGTLVRFVVLVLLLTLPGCASVTEAVGAGMAGVGVVAVAVSGAELSSETSCSGQLGSPCPSDSAHTAEWVGLGVGAALIVGGGILVLAAVTAHDAKAHGNDPPPPAPPPIDPPQVFAP